MIKTNALNASLIWLTTTIRFFKKHFAVVMTLGLIAGLGRVAQLRGFGPVSPNMHFALEVIIESARLLLLVYVVGSANITHGFRRIALAFRKDQGQKMAIKNAMQHFRSKWKEMLLNFFAYLAIAFIFNLLIDQLAYQTCLYLTMTTNGILSTDSSEWTIILFFKNLTVIPLTLVFNAVFLFYVTGKMKTFELIKTPPRSYP